MKSIIDSLRNFVQPKQPHVPSSPTGTHSPVAIHDVETSPVAATPFVDQLEPCSSHFQTPLERPPPPTPSATSRELVLFTRPIVVPPPGSDESTSTDSIPGSPSASAGSVSETTRSASPLLITNPAGAARRVVSPHTSPIEVSHGDEVVPVTKKRRVLSRGGSGPASRVRSARSQSTGPHAIVDSTRFHSFDAQTRYDRFKSQNLLCEDVFVLEELPAGIRKFIVRVGFHRTLTDVEPFDDDVVREFWVYLPSVKSEDVLVRVWLRGHEYEFSSVKVNALFGLPDVDDFAFLEQSARVTDSQLAGYLSGNRHSSLAALTTASCFTEDMRSLLRMCGTNWSPTLNPFYKNRTRLMLLYKMGNGIPFNFGKLVVDHILSVARSSVAKLYLPFPSLIFRLLTAQRPVVRLSPGVPPRSSPEPVVGPTDKSDHATVSGSSSLKLQQAIRQAIQILQAALTGGDETEQTEESRAKAKGKRKAA
ncbi:hypothetical protein AALP_AA6G121000 [Arabis alpina]|uniref:Putative plant transposon protein domain-containing protein n=1 Tax=Arabis alpina TaxID=50452 RepID=A0A087GNQ1_ARAAL|nr:hypothetical protein AALP_AA6G121000 [Arabis alpina]